MNIRFVVTKGCLAMFALIINAATVMAQSSKLPNPADPGAAAPAVEHRSAFSDFQPFRDEKIRSWKEVNQEVADNPGMGSMKGMPGIAIPGMDKHAASAPMSKEGHGAGITATGVVQSIDKANGKVKLTHDPIAALGWPKMTMFFRLKDSMLADQVKEGDKVEFSLEKSASGYVISGFQKRAASHEMKQMK
jgi:Cu/Ag efflux protein CusF